MKRAIDCLLSIFCLIVFSPLMAFCAIAIRHEDGLPVIFKQERIGRHGRPFLIYKFRTMRIDAEPDNIPHLLETSGDPRLTHISLPAQPPPRRTATAVERTEG